MFTNLLHQWWIMFEQHKEIQDAYGKKARGCISITISWTCTLIGGYTPKMSNFVWGRKHDVLYGSIRCNLEIPKSFQKIALFLSYSFSFLATDPHVICMCSPKAWILEVCAWIMSTKSLVKIFWPVGVCIVLRMHRQFCMHLYVMRCDNYLVNE
jgi:hypothetical protein